MDFFALDTNIILRFLENDIPQQAKITENKLKEAQSGKINIYIYQITIVEIIYQLINWYKKDKKEACDILLAFLTPDWICVEEKEVVFQTIQVFRDKNIDFVDILLYLKASSDGRQVLSFDKHFDKLAK